MGWVYLMKADDADEYKIGCTRKRHAIRRVNAVGKREREGWLVYALETRWPFVLEADMHRHFAAVRVRGEWFALSAAQVEEFKAWGENAVSDPAKSTWPPVKRPPREAFVNPKIPIVYPVRGGRAASG